MRYPSNRKEESRQKILQAAARLFREHGYNGVGVDAVMAEAGLTPGGFYAHFPSKEALFAEALASSFKARSAAVGELLKHHSDADWIQALVSAYLSRTHRDMVSEGCPLPALTPDVTRSSPEARQMYEKYIQRLVSEICKRLSTDAETDRRLAIALVSQMIGGLMLARAVESSPFSDEILKANRTIALQLCQDLLSQKTEDPPADTNLE